MLEKKTVIGKIEILESGFVQVRTDTVILDDGEEISRTYHRSVLAPGDDIEHLIGTRVADVCSAVWTPDTVSTFRATQALTATGAPAVLEIVKP